MERFVNVDRATKRPYPGGLPMELTGPYRLDELNLEHMVSPSELAGYRATGLVVLGARGPSGGQAGTAR